MRQRSAQRGFAFVPNANFANNGDGHGISHTGWTSDEAEAKAEVVAFYTRAAATFAANLASTPEGTGSLLDNTLGFFFTECRHGEHERRRNPCMLFGGKFLKLNAGQYVTSPSRYTNDLWATVLTAWGAPTKVFGDPQYGTGTLAGLFG